MQLAKAYFHLVTLVMLLTLASTSIVAQCPFAPDGYFVFAGPAPKGFNDVALIALWDYRRKRGTELSPGVYLTDANAFALEESTITTGPNGLGFTWVFSTFESNGVRYVFDGRFQDVCNFADPSIGKAGRVLLEGRLERREHNVTIAAADAKFVFYARLPPKLRRLARFAGSHKGKPLN